MPLSPPIPAPANTLVYAKVAAYCNQFMNPVHTYLAPPVGSSPYNMCIHYGWNLPAYHGSFNTGGGSSGGGLLVLGIAAFLGFCYLVRRTTHPSGGKA